MTGLNGHRVYLDWNASAPLRPEARAAMLSAMDEVGNPSSVHGEGRRAKAIVERARAQAADLVGCDSSGVVFTSGATEAAMLALKDAAPVCAGVEHDAVIAWSRAETQVDRQGRIAAADVDTAQAANSETGVMQTGIADAALVFSDTTQIIGKAAYSFAARAQSGACVSSHKIGGPKGVGALIMRGDYPFRMRILGGGQEQGRRAGTENVIGAAGFGAAAEAARRDLETGVWDRGAEIRDLLEARLADAASDLIVFGMDAPRLPNTSCFAIPGWKGETQVMQMDLAGFAISAGSACSSGKVNKASRVLLAMGFDEITASSAIRVSTGPTTTEAEVMAFADAWISAYARWKQKAA